MPRVKIKYGKKGETEFQEQVIKWFKDTFKENVVINNVWGRSGVSGIADLQGCLFGKFFAIELKVPGHKTDPDRLAKQKSYVRKVQRAGGMAGFAETMEEVIQIISPGCPLGYLV